MTSHTEGPSASSSPRGDQSSAEQQQQRLLWAQRLQRHIDKSDRMGSIQSPEKRRRVDPSLVQPDDGDGNGNGEMGILAPPEPSASSSELRASAPLAALGEMPVEHDDADEDAASLTASIMEHNFENGLRYHGYRAGLYPFPNDEIFQNMDRWAHKLSFDMCHGKYFLAPVEDRLEYGEAKVLDLATGIGIWCEELADKYPRSYFEGIDLSPIQSPIVPPNVRFFVDDMEHEHGWEFGDSKFDFIHLRHTIHTVRDRPELIQRAFEHLKPGGYLEIQDVESSVYCDDGTVPEGDGYAYREWLRYLGVGLAGRGCDLHAARHLAAHMRAAGFEAVTEDQRKCPIGPWPADRHLRLCGQWLAEVILAGLRGFSGRPFTTLGWTTTQIEMFLITVREHVRSIEYHAWMPFRTVHGRKPLA